MFKQIVLSTTLLFSFSVKAQYASGTYVLKQNPTKVETGNLAINDLRLRVKADNGRITAFKANEVVYVENGKGKRLVPAQDFYKHQLAFSKQKKAVFVELLDSGRLWLMQYEYTTPTGFGPNGLAGGAANIYLVRPEGSAEVTTLPPYTWINKGNKLRETLRAYISDRPDLIAVVNDGAFQELDLPTLFRAINSGQPYTK
jgi:hypothetical protein